MSLLHRIRQAAKRLKAESFMLFYAYRNPKTPWLAKALIALTLGYLFSPIDLIPDFIPILGLLDDLLLVPLLIRLSIRLIPHDILIESRRQAQRRTEESRPTTVWFIGVVISFWLVIGYRLHRWLRGS